MDKLNKLGFEAMILLRSRLQAASSSSKWRDKRWHTCKLKKHVLGNLWNNLKTNDPACSRRGPGPPHPRTCSLWGTSPPAINSPSLVFFHKISQSLVWSPSSSQEEYIFMKNVAARRNQASTMSNFVEGLWSEKTGSQINRTKDCENFLSTRSWEPLTQARIDKFPCWAVAPCHFLLVYCAPPNLVRQILAASQNISSTPAKIWNLGPGATTEIPRCEGSSQAW